MCMWLAMSTWLAMCSTSILAILKYLSRCIVLYQYHTFKGNATRWSVIVMYCKVFGKLPDLTVTSKNDRILKENLNYRKFAEKNGSKLHNRWISAVLGNLKNKPKQHSKYKQSMASGIFKKYSLAYDKFQWGN